MFVKTLCFAIFILHPWIGVSVTESSSAIDNTKLELSNLSIAHLTNTFLKNFGVDVSHLKISSSKIEVINNDAFNSFNHLNLLDLSDNRIKARIDRQTFANLPGLEILVLRNIGLVEADFNLTNVQELILSQNNLEELRGEAIQGKRVNYLDASWNRIQELKFSLGSLDKLSLIDISRNYIQEIGEDVFKNNPFLVTISAAENRISSFKGLRLPHLKTLDLFSNRIYALNSDSFTGMSSLEELVLALNRIKVLVDPFKDLIELKYLNLAWNSIEEIPPELFKNNLYLTHLSVQGNKLKSLKRFVGYHEHLNNLDLSHNQLGVIDNDFFLSIPNIKVLDVSFNRIKSVANTLAPLEGLKFLDMSYNILVLSGNEFIHNTQLTRVNLSSNNLDSGFSQFKNNPSLISLDLSENFILDFCEQNMPSKNLRKLYLKGNHIKSLNCLMNEGFEDLCQVDMRNNPLKCGEDLDELLNHLAVKKVLPFSLMVPFQSDTIHGQCESVNLNQSLNLWKNIKSELCIGGDLLKTNTLKQKMLDQIDEASENLSREDSDSFEDDASDNGVDEEKKFVVVPLENSQALQPPVIIKESQSERISWEQIDQNQEFVKNFEEQEAVMSGSYNWYTIALALIGISFALTCFNLLVFLYMRLKIWKKSETSGPLKYTFLQNEIYKNTTEPTNPNDNSSHEWLSDYKLKNKIFSYGKINELLLNFGSMKKDSDRESMKNILVHAAPNPTSQN